MLLLSTWRQTIDLQGEARIGGCVADSAKLFDQGCFASSRGSLDDDQSARLKPQVASVVDDFDLGKFGAGSAPHLSQLKCLATIDEQLMSASAVELEIGIQGNPAQHRR